jgi:hypothetical protein
MGCPMQSHKFHVGESVTLRPAISRNVSGGVYEVTKQLPHSGREFEYRGLGVNFYASTLREREYYALPAMC